MPRLNRNASPSASIRHTSAPTRSGGPSGGTTSSCTVVPVFSRALVLTFAPRVLMFTELDKYRLVPTLTTIGQATRVRGWRRRSCCRRRGMTVTPGDSCPPGIGPLIAYRAPVFSHERPTSSTAMLPPRSHSEDGRGTLRLPDSFIKLSMTTTRLFVSVSTACMRLIPPTSSHPANPNALGFPEMLRVPRMPMMATTIMSSMSVKPRWVSSAFLSSCQKLTMDANLLCGPSGPTVWIENDGHLALYLAPAVPNLESLTRAQIHVDDDGEADAGDPRWPSRGRILEVL